MISSLPASYQGALAWLYAQTRGGRARDPERMRALLGALGLTMPAKSVHVVGTNGKGTVAAMIAAAYTASGRRTGHFLSPHVEDFRERIGIDGRPIGEAEVTAFVQRVMAKAFDPAPAFFELTLAMALGHFATAGAQIAVVEAGVGAKNDATLVLERVSMVVITNVGRDHLDTLGPGLGDVARDKAAALRPGVPVVTAATGEALEVIAQEAAARGSPLLTETSHPELFTLPDIKAADPVRRQNLRLATAALRAAGDVGEEAILRGLQTARLPARGEAFELAGRTVILDGAHNPDAAAALRATLTTPYVLVFGSLPRKLGEETLFVLEPDALSVIITQVDGQPGPIHDLCTFVSEPIQALERALTLCPAEARVVVAGSLHLAGQLRPYLRRHHQPHPLPRYT